MYSCTNAKRTIPQSATLTAPFTQGSLLLLSLPCARGGGSPQARRRGCKEEQSLRLRLRGASSLYTREPFHFFASPVQGEVACRRQVGGVVKKNNPSDSAYAEPAPFTQGSLLLLSLPCARGGDLPQARRRGCHIL